MDSGAIGMNGRLKKLMLGLVVLLNTSQSFGENFMHEIQTHNDLKKMDFKTVARHKKGSLSRFEGIWILNLHGTREEMAEQHGVLAKDYIADSALPFFANKIHKSIENTYIAQEFPPFAPVAKWFIDQWVHDPLIQMIPPEDIPHLKAFSKASGYNYRSLLTAMVVPDAGQWLISKIFGKNKVLEGFFKPINGLGCTTFISGEKENENGFIHARNLDYDSYGIFGKNPAVIYFHPEDESELSYASFTSLGLHTAGITAFNEAGIAYSLHQTMVDSVSQLGTPILSVNDYMIRHATNLEDAVNFYRLNDFAGSWAIHISSVKEKKSASIEVSADGVEIKYHDDAFMYATNHVHSKMMQEKEFSYHYQYYEDTRLRYQNLANMFQFKKSVSLQESIDRISSQDYYKKDGTIENRSVHGVIAKMNNIQSVVMAPETGWAYIAMPKEQFAKPVTGNYVPVPMRFEILRNVENVENSFLNTPKTKKPSFGPTLEQVKAHADLRRASALATENEDYEQAIMHLESAFIKEPKEVHYPILIALSALGWAGQLENRSEIDEKLSLMLEWLEQAEELNPQGYMKTLVALFKGRYYDLTNQRQKAFLEYVKIDSSYSKKVEQVKEKAFKKQYKLKEVKKMVVDYLHIDLHQF